MTPWKSHTRHEDSTIVAGRVLDVSARAMKKAGLLAAGAVLGAVCVSACSEEDGTATSAGYGHGTGGTVLDAGGHDAAHAGSGGAAGAAGHGGAHAGSGGTPGAGGSVAGGQGGKSAPEADAGGCGAGQTLCSGTCVNTATDNANCGSCGKACSSGQPCSGGTCACQPNCSNKPLGEPDGCGGECSASASCGGMLPGSSLSKGSSLSSCDGVAKLSVQSDDNVVLYNTKDGRALWATGTNGKGVALLTMQTDGNLVVYDPSWNPLWNSKTYGHSGATLSLQSDCNMVIYESGTAIWQSNTTCDCPKGQTLCAASCVDTAKDAKNCGGCGNVCPSGQACSNGGCAAPTGRKFAAGGGVIGDLSWLKSNGFSEFHFVVPDTSSHASERQAISAAGLRAVINPFNDGNGVGPGADASGWSWFFPSLASAGWSAAAGEGEGDSLISLCQQSMIYINYGGIVGDAQYDMYSPPWNHPATGNFPHWDYIETYDNNANLVLASTKASIMSAHAHGSQRIGILIGAWLLSSSQTWINFVTEVENDGVHVDTFFFWTGLAYDIVPVLQGSNVWRELQQHYGVDTSQ